MLAAKPRLGNFLPASDFQGPAKKLPAAARVEQADHLAGRSTSARDIRSFGQIAEGTNVLHPKLTGVDPH